MSSNKETRHFALSETLEVDGKVWTLSPPDLKDFAELEDFLQSEVMRKVGQQLPHLPPEFAKARFERALEDSEKIKVGTKEFDNAALQPFGQIHLLYLLLRHKHPEITKDQSLAVFTKAAGISEKIEKVSGYIPDPQQAQEKN